jgi:Tol biopolymer transport system component
MLLLQGCDYVLRLDEVPAPPDARTTPCTPGEWSAPARVSANSTEHDEDPALHPDGSIIVFTRSRGTADRDLYVATRSGLDFVDATLLPFSTTTEVQKGAFWSPQGDRLYFEHANDFHVSAYVDGVFATPVPTTEFDSLAFVQRPRLASDELELFYERGIPTDIWHATRLSPSAPWNEQSLDDVSSSEADEGVSVTSDDLTIYFASRRAAGERHIFTATREARTSAFGDVTDLGNFGIEAPVSPDISRDGLTMVFAGFPTAQSDIYVMHRPCE